MLLASALGLLLNAAWQVTLIAVLATVAASALRPAPAWQRHFSYVAALVASVGVPLASQLKEAAWLGRSLRSAATSTLATTNIDPGTINAGRSLSLSIVWAALIVGVAALLMSWRLARLLFAAWSTRALARGTLQPLDPASNQLATRAADVLGVDRFHLLASPSLAGPITYGLFTPTIVIPAALTQPHSRDLLSAALGHELAHVRRRDFLWNLLLELLMVPLAFHPAAWFLKRRADETRELACDEAVATALVEPRLYARCLLQLATTALAAGATRSNGYVMGAVAPPLLEERVRQLIVNPRRRQNRLAALLATVVLLCAGASALATTHLSIHIAAPDHSTVEATTNKSIDWLAQGIAACRAEDSAAANRAFEQLNEWDRAELLTRCLSYGQLHCDSGFHPPE